ncbi:hypothetical protein CI610_00686 [invertebrate metagenome]|uniref:Uncharacterized protein n=1 Tax=invertebrate metagenome TaxID=1711999 RepID=A0A2H9TAT6_9ZZZZ
MKVSTQSCVPTSLLLIQSGALKKSITLKRTSPPEEAALDVLAHTLLHEFGHALINMNHIPVVVKEEDAADGFATYLLIEILPGGLNTLLTAADMFELEGEDFDTL